MDGKSKSIVANLKVKILKMKVKPMLANPKAIFRSMSNSMIVNTEVEVKGAIEMKPNNNTKSNPIVWYYTFTELCFQPIEKHVLAPTELVFVLSCQGRNVVSSSILNYLKGYTNGLNND